MSDYSIELAVERIVDPRTKRYFGEVYGCYTTGHYRSAVVMLWSVVVTDLLFKLDHLQNAYADTTAQAILTEIGNLRTSNPKSPEWEAELVNKVASRTDLIDPAELSVLQALQNHRHLSAHPVMTGNDALYSPNQETTRAHIRNALDSVLTKPPIMSRKVFDTFIEDIEQIARLGLGSEEMKKYPEAKYFRHFSTASFAHIFKSLWRVAFRSSAPRCEQNRAINAQALAVVLARKTPELTETIKSERDWFSDVSFSDSVLDALTQFFQGYPQVFSLLTDAVKTPIQRFADRDMDSFVNCWFINQNTSNHIDEVLRRIDDGQVVRPEALKRAVESLAITDCVPKVLHAGIRCYTKSRSFDAADSRFEELVRPFIGIYDREHYVALLEVCETCHNGQATGRGRAYRDHLQVKEGLDKICPDLNLDHYPAFKGSITAV